MYICVTGRAQGHLQTNKQRGSLITGSGRCDVSTELLLPTVKQAEQEVEQAILISLMCYLSYPKFAGPKLIVVS